MAKKHRGGKVKHAPGYVCIKAAKVSPEQVRAREKKAKEIAAGKKKKQDQASALRAAEKDAKRQRRMESGKRFY